MIIKIAVFLFYFILFYLFYFILFYFIKKAVARAMFLGKCLALKAYIREKMSEMKDLNFYSKKLKNKLN